ncbi:amidase [Kushneria marisflavi]|uniref:Amidase n=1 Tax=Kushneria marisflavi TaxID=157779 RepID=A0A240USE1_9GAMM|nr:amidase [Kushneria marisflavi]ART64056.1 amidase [Kushneria marisflavi]RKD85789.1 amidase [Kushneria marisflavi]
MSQAASSAESFPDIVRWDASRLSSAIHARDVSCREVMSAYLAHIDRFNPRINAIVSRRDSDELIREADQCDLELDQGRSRGWLHGIPQAIKDLSDARGLPTSMGSPLFVGQSAGSDSLMAARLRQAGALFIGKTNTPEFGLGSHTFNEVHGATRNPWQPALSAGGSSGGAAAALACRLLPVADGSDMMGSLRNPAAFNNVFGLRPSFGRVPMLSAGDNFGQQLSTAGPMARSVSDLSRLLSLQAGAHSSVPLSITDDPTLLLPPFETSVAGTRIGWIGDWEGYLAMEEGVLPLCEKALNVFQTLGCEIAPVTPGIDPDSLWSAWLVLRQWAVAGNLSSLWQDSRCRDALKPEACWEIERGVALSAMQVFEANRTRSRWYACLLELFERYDYLALPSAQVFPFPVEQRWPSEINGRTMDTYHRWTEVVIPGSMSGCPVISLPAGFNDNGLPMGVQLIGRHRAERAMLALAGAYEAAATGWIDALPDPMMTQGVL